MLSVSGALSGRPRGVCHQTPFVTHNSLNIEKEENHSWKLFMEKKKLKPRDTEVETEARPPLEGRVPKTGANAAVPSTPAPGWARGGGRR